MAERGLGGGQEVARVHGLAQGAGADRAHALERELAQALTEALEAGHRPCLGLLTEALLVVEAGGQGDPLAQAVEDVKWVSSTTRATTM